ncbi:MAG: arginine--tRNA ligase, partial [Thermoleophilaceae bacterium]
MSPHDDPITALRATISSAARSVDGASSVEPKLERPPRPDFGDYSTNAAMLLAPSLGEPPRPVAERLGAALADVLGEELERIDVAGPGFLNLFMTDAWFRRALATMAAAGDRWGGGRADPVERILIEFVSANPTGPVTAASGRHAAYGDSLARLFEFAGHSPEREYYVNDAGSQIVRFGESIKARARGEEPPEDGYRGDYVTELAKKIPGAADADPAELARKGVELMVKDIAKTLERFRVRMDGFFSELSLYESGAVDRGLAEMEARGHVYSSEGAMWLRTTAFEDDKDRVLKRSSGEVTYLGSDIAYHQDKLRRGYDRVINVWGPDHHGYIARMKGVWDAIGG